MAYKPVKLEPESQSYLDIAKQAGPLDLSLSLDVIRHLNELTAQRLKGDWLFPGTSEEVIISAEDRGTSYNVPLTILRPSAQSGESCSNVLIYFHGGGWTWGSRATLMKFCEMISE